MLQPLSHDPFIVFDTGHGFCRQNNMDVLYSVLNTVKEGRRFSHFSLGSEGHACLRRSFVGTSGE